MLLVHPGGNPPGLHHPDGEFSRTGYRPFYIRYIYLMGSGDKTTAVVMFVATRRRRRRTRSVRRTGTEKGGRTGTVAETNENAPVVRRRRAKTRSEIVNASPTVKKEMLR